MMAKRRSGTSDRRASDGVCEIDFVDPHEVAAARELLPPARALRATADAFKALGNPSRLQILIALEDRELCVCDIAELLGVSMSGASQHLRTLRNLGAVDYRKNGDLAWQGEQQSNESQAMPPVEPPTEQVLALRGSFAGPGAAEQDVSATAHTRSR